MLDGFVEN